MLGIWDADRCLISEQLMAAYMSTEYRVIVGAEILVMRVDRSNAEVGMESLPQSCVAFVATEASQLTARRGGQPSVVQCSVLPDRAYARCRKGLRLNVQARRQGVPKQRQWAALPRHKGCKYHPPGLRASKHVPWKRPRLP
jgi:hypothetical protein